MLNNYKTEPCPRWFSGETNRVCRLGAMCPHYHSSRDRRRKRTVIKYRYFCCWFCHNSVIYGVRGEEGAEAPKRWWVVLHFILLCVFLCMLVIIVDMVCFKTDEKAAG